MLILILAQKFSFLIIHVKLVVTEICFVLKIFGHGI